MARYYRRRYTKVVRPKKRWATNMYNFSGAILYGSNNTIAYSKQLVENNTEGSSPAPVMIKAGNFKAQFDTVLTVGASGDVSARAYIVYVPQGYTIPTDASMFLTISNIVGQHPEWILVWRQLDFGNANAAGSVDTSVVRMSSRLKRNLNTGDSIYFFLIGQGEFAGVTTKGAVAGACQYWTCAN